MAVIALCLGTLKAQYYYSLVGSPIQHNPSDSNSVARELANGFFDTSPTPKPFSFLSVDGASAFLHKLTYNAGTYSIVTTNSSPYFCLVLIYYSFYDQVRCPPGEAIRVDNTVYNLVGGRVEDMHSAGDIKFSRINENDLSGNFLQIVMSQVRTISAIAVLGASTKVLSGQVLRIIDYSSMTILKTTSNYISTNFKFITCLDASTCVSADDGTSGIRIYDITSSNFLNAPDTVSANPLVGVSECIGLSIIKTLTMYTYCSQSTCYFKRFSSGTVYPSYSLPSTAAKKLTVLSPNILVVSVLGPTASTNGLYFFDIFNSLTTPCVFTSLRTISSGYYFEALKPVGADYLIASLEDSIGDPYVYFYEKKLCDPSCATCRNSSSNGCLSCVAPLFLSSGQCISCHSSCATCNGP
jgi:hypothetical protein